jgi:hypothetical protein
MSAQPGEMPILDFSDRLHKSKDIVDDVLWPLTDSHWGSVERQFRFQAEPGDYVRICRSADILGRAVCAELEADCSKWEVDAEKVTVSTTRLTVEERVDDTNRDIFLEMARLSLGIWRRYLWGDEVDEPIDEEGGMEEVLGPIWPEAEDAELTLRRGTTFTINSLGDFDVASYRTVEAADTRIEIPICEHELQTQDDSGEMEDDDEEREDPMQIYGLPYVGTAELETIELGCYVLQAPRALMETVIFMRYRPLFFANK